MSEADTSQNYEPVRVNPVEEAVQGSEVSKPVTHTKPSFREEINRAWKWVVFVCRMLPRLGGVRGIVQSLFLITSLLITRLLAQWGLISKK